MNTAVMTDQREASTSNIATNHMAKPGATAAAPDAERSSKRGRKPGKPTKAKETVEPITRFFGGEIEDGIPKLTREYENETTALIDTVANKKKFFAVTIWRAEHEIISPGKIEVVKRPANSEQQSA
jgi:hypothetical protein